LELLAQTLDVTACTRGLRRDHHRDPPKDGLEEYDSNLRAYMSTE